MTVTDLVHRLESDSRYDYLVEKDGSVTIADLHLTVDGEPGHHPLTNFTPEALEQIRWVDVCHHAAQGRDVDHITRVTGYFSKTSGWNKGKTAELNDRHRSAL